MKIYINSEPHEVKDKIKLFDLLQSKSYNLDKIAVEINKEIILKSTWKDFELQNDMKLEIVQFVAGG